MPEVLSGLSDEEKPQAIAALTAFLGSQQEDFPEIKATGVVPVPYEFWSTGDSELGKQLYHQVGCVACHEPSTDYETAEAAPTPIDQLLEQLDPEELEEMGLGSALRPVQSVPHGDLAAKYSRKSLTHFLFNPERDRPSGRMPNLKLAPMEAAHIAAYLLREQKPTSNTNEAVDQSLVDEGKRLFETLGCANCHSAKGVNPKLEAKSLSEIDFNSQATCFSKAAPGRPFYPLDQFQTTSIKSALAEQSSKATPASQLQLRLLKLNCFACHERDDLGGVGRNRKPYFETVRHIDIGDEGRLPPALTGVGRKLTGKWLKTVFEGKGDVRPHVVARMPKFPKAVTADLPELLTKVDRAGQPKPKPVPAKQEQYVAAGLTLLDTGCVECHPLRGESLPGVVGVDLFGTTSRLEYDWFQQFLLNPAALKKRTRMPTFFPDGKSQNKAVLQGNTEQQITAMWNFLREADKHALPAKIEQARSQDYELVPEDKPILLRTFMHQAGTHALAVGFQEQVHFAFDTHRLRLAEAWRGRFLDARGTWFERFTPPAIPLGEDRMEFPPGAALAILQESNQPWPTFEDESQQYRFAGYQLDAQGIPTLLYHVGDYQVHDRIVPDQHSGLLRTLTISTVEPTGKLWLRGNLGAKLETNGNSTTNQTGLTVQLNGEAQIIQVDDSSEWRMPVKVDKETTIEMRYRW